MVGTGAARDAYLEESPIARRDAVRGCDEQSYSPLLRRSARVTVFFSGVSMPDLAARAERKQW